MTSSRRFLLRIGLVAGLVAAGAAAGPAPAQAAELPELTSMVVHLPIGEYTHELIAGETFRVTFTIDRPAPPDGTWVQLDHLRDSGPLHLLPQFALVPAGQRTVDMTVSSLPVDPATETAVHQQIYAYTTDLNLPGNVTLDDSLLALPRPATDPRGNAVTQEAEAGRLGSAKVVHETGPYSLASGGAFVQYTGSRGFADFTFVADRTAEHWVILRYSNDGYAPSKMAVTINGVRRVVTLGIGAGPAWFRLDGFRGVQLHAGANKIRVAPVSGQTPVNLDWVQIAVA